VNTLTPGAPPVDSVHIRKAVTADLDDLVRLEEACFDSDRLSRRSFRKLLGSHTADCAVALLGNRVVGYALLLFRAGTGLARLYSIAVAPDLRGTGVGQALFGWAEQIAFERDRVLLRLEVRDDNEPAIRLYERLGYRRIGRYLSYYQDKTDALRFEKWLRGPNRPTTTVPYYEQTTDFTCGPCCLLMAIKHFRPEFAMGPVEEIRLWRESTSVFMMSGTGGCDPHGLAVAAAAYGIAAEVHVSHEGGLFLDSVRSAEKRRVMDLAQEDFRRQAVALGVPIRHEPYGLDDLRAAIADGAVAVVLVSAFRMFRKKVPHWVLVVGDDGRNMVIHDPWVEDRELESHVDAANLPIPHGEFGRMARYGRQGLRATVVLRRKDRDG
jgi:ribosomal protein S18 acetylase RimI-like enzyme